MSSTSPSHHGHHHLPGGAALPMPGGEPLLPHDEHAAGAAASPPPPDLPPLPMPAEPAHAHQQQLHRHHDDAHGGAYPDANAAAQHHQQQQHYQPVPHHYQQHHHEEAAYHAVDPAAAAANLNAGAGTGGAEYHPKGNVGHEHGHGHGHQHQQQQQHYNSTIAANHRAHGYLPGQQEAEGGYGPPPGGEDGAAAAGQWDYSQQLQTHAATTNDHTHIAANNNMNMYENSNHQQQQQHGQQQYQGQSAHHGAAEGGTDASQEGQRQHHHEFQHQHQHQQYAYHQPEGQGHGQPQHQTLPPVVEQQQQQQQQEYMGHQHQQPYTHHGTNEHGGGADTAAVAYNHHYAHHGDATTGTAAAATMEGTYHAHQAGTDGTYHAHNQQAQQAQHSQQPTPQYYHQHVGGETHQYQQQRQQQQQHHHDQVYAATNNNNMQPQHYENSQAHHTYAQHPDQHVNAGAMSGINALHAAATGGYGVGHGYPYHGAGAAAAAALAADGEGGGRGRRPQQHHHHHTPVPSDEAWERKFQQLQEFYREFGHSDVPQTYKLNKPLGKWVGKQREHWKAKQETGSSTLTDERVRKLETVDFKFYMGKGSHGKHHGLFMTERNAEEFNRRFQELVEFKAKHGHCKVPFADPKYNGLAQWCSRFNRKLRSHRLTGPLAVSLTTTEPEIVDDNATEGVGNDTAATDQSHPTDPVSDNSNTGDAAVAAQGDNASTTKVSPKEKELRILLQRMRKLEDLGGFDFDFGFHRKDGIAADTMTNQDRWDETFEALKQYKERVGNADVPSTYREGKDKKDATLATWVAKQRELWRNKQCGRGRKLSDEREAKLASLGLNFEIMDAKWNSRYAELEEYHKKYGTADVPERRDVRSLYHWCNRQREAFHQFLEDNSGPMTNDHIAKLEKLGFDWKYEKTHKRLEAKKAKAASRSKKSKRRAGRPKKKDTPVATSTAEAETTVAAVGGPTEVTPVAPIVEVDQSEIEGLEAALRDAIQCYGSYADSQKGGKANTDPDKWLSMFQQLIHYKKDHGHCKVSQAEKGYDGLGLWVKVQRDNYRDLCAKKQGPMSEWRLELLHKIGFTFDAANHRTFEARLEQLRLFKAEFGHTKVPQNFERNKPLGKWVAKMRDQYRQKENGNKHKLTDDQISQLESIGFQWRVGRGKATKKWDDFYQDLLKFRQEHGHFNVPFNYAPNPSLSIWANQQRSNYRNQVLGKTINKSMREHNQKLIDTGFNFHVDPDQEPIGEKDSPSRKRKSSAPAKEGSAVDDEASNEATKPAAKRSKKSDENAIDDDIDPLPPLHDGGLQDGLLAPSHNGDLQGDAIDDHDDIGVVFADI